MTNSISIGVRPATRGGDGPTLVCAGGLPSGHDRRLRPNPRWPVGLRRRRPKATAAAQPVGVCVWCRPTTGKGCAEPPPEALGNLGPVTYPPWCRGRDRSDPPRYWSNAFSQAANGEQCAASPRQHSGLPHPLASLGWPFGAQSAPDQPALVRWIASGLRGKPNRGAFHSARPVTWRVVTGRRVGFEIQP
jgi:hypothetical protein